MTTKVPTITALIIAIIILAGVSTLILKIYDVTLKKPRDTSQVLQKGDASQIDQSAHNSANARELLQGKIYALYEALKSGNSSLGGIVRLKQLLLSEPSTQSIPAILDFLHSSADAPTGTNFVLGTGGSIQSLPTLRLYLIDILGEISRRDKLEAATAYADEIFKMKVSSDEWALSLRNTALQDNSKELMISSKTEEMLSWEQWQKDPSDGFLESFDFAVYTQDVNLLPLLSSFAASGDRKLAKASIIAMARMVDANPYAVHAFLNNHPSALNNLKESRADYFSEADFSDVADERQLEIYLSRDDIDLNEKKRCVSQLGVSEKFFSKSLVTPNLIERHNEAANDSALNETVKRWVAENRFPQLTPALHDLISATAKN